MWYLQTSCDISKQRYTHKCAFKVPWCYPKTQISSKNESGFFRKAVSKVRKQQKENISFLKYECKLQPFSYTVHLRSWQCCMKNKGFTLHKCLIYFPNNYDAPQITSYRSFKVQQGRKSNTIKCTYLLINWSLFRHRVPGKYSCHFHRVQLLHVKKITYR